MSSQFDLVDFRLFANIAEMNSFTSGAECSNLSTSAASLRIRHLEESLQVALFHRTSQGATLTPAGQAFLRRARTILDQFEHLKADVHVHSSDAGRQLRVSVGSPGVSDPLPKVLREYMKLYPSVTVALDVRMSSEVAAAVSEGAADIGIGGTNRLIDVEVLPYVRDRLVLAVPLNHPLAHASSLRFADALDYYIIGHPEGTTVQMFMRRIAENSRKPIRMSMSVSSHGALCRLVEAEVGIGVISERIGSFYARMAGIKLIDLKDKAAIRDINICVRSLSGLPDFAKHFVTLLQDNAKTDT